MISNPSPHGGIAAKKAGQRLGWTALHTNSFVLYKARFVSPATSARGKRLLLLGKVLSNDRDSGKLILQPYRARWMHSSVRYVPLYQSSAGPTINLGEVLQETVSYADLVYPAELKANGGATDGRVSLEPGPCRRTKWNRKDEKMPKF